MFFMLTKNYKTRALLKLLQSAVFFAQSIRKQSQVCIVNDVDSAKKYRQVRGVNRSRAEYTCVQSDGIFEGPEEDASVKKIKAWNVNVVRVPLNEDCWLGINGHNASYSGKNYRDAVFQFVIRDNNMKVILDLHWSDVWLDSEYEATSQKPMPDATNAPSFWKSVATEFKNDDDIIFDIFNEPYPEGVINTSDSTAIWQCWRDGGSACSNTEYEVAGMQSLVDAIRCVGANNLIIIGGVSFSGNLSRWDEFKTTDSANNIAPSWHTYSPGSCTTEDCWEQNIAPLASNYDLVVGEMGELSCNHSYIDALMPWLDERQISYTAWTWNTWDCSAGPALISDYEGTPTNYGAGLKDHLACT